MLKLPSVTILIEQKNEVYEGEYFYEVFKIFIEQIWTFLGNREFGR